MVLYRNTLVSLAEDLKEADYTLLSPLYANDEVFYVLARWNADQLKLLMSRGLDRGYFPDPSRSLFISDNPEDKEETRRKFERVGLNLN